MKSAKDLLVKLWQEKANVSVLPDLEVRNAWQAVSSEPWAETVEEPSDMPQIPTAEKLLELGTAAKVDFVCAGRLKWHIKSVWVGLGPKTKAYATVDMRIIDVSKKEVVLDVKDFRSDTGKAEKWYETAGALLLTWGITLVSGGPKTPHVQKSALLAVGGSSETFFSTQAQSSKKIGGPTR